MELSSAHPAAIGPAAIGPAPARTRNWPGRLCQIGWTLVPVVTGGLLAFAPFLRLAIVRQEKKDWAVFAAYLAAVVTTTIVNSLAPSLAGAALVPVVLIVAAVSISTSASPKPK